MAKESKIVKIAKKLIKEHPEYFNAFLEFEKTGKLPKITPKKNPSKR